MAGYDVVVIGSGAGGAPIAQRLAKRGAKVLIVEKGKRYTREDFGRDEIEWCRRDKLIPSPMRDPHTRRNDEGQRAVPTTDGWISTVVGGGTVHMGAYLLRADPADAKQRTRFGTSGNSAIDWAVPFEDVAKHYAIAEQEIGVSGAPSEGAPAALNAHSASVLVDQAAKELGLPSMPTPRAILSVGRPEDDRLPCAYRQLCASYGCPNDAKGSMIATYLRQAERAGAELRPETMCTGVVVDAKGQVTGVKLQTRGKAPETVSAARVVIACGAIESARLLLLSGDAFQPGGLANPHGQIGKNLWFSLFVEATGFLDKGAHQGVADLMHGSPFLNRTVMAGGVLDEARQKQSGVDRTGTLQLGFVHDNPIHRAERVATEGGLLWGRKLKEQLKRTYHDGRSVVVEGFGESVPHAGAYVDLDPNMKDWLGQPAARITHFHHPRDVKVAKQMGADATALLTKMGATDVKVTRQMGETTVLQGGTCRFGSDPRTSVTAPDGQVHGTKGLYVTDGGSLPSSLAVPVTLTLVANALRIAEGMAKAG
jgi:choline dehydrogenase-like flavoprotein